MCELMVAAKLQNRKMSYKPPVTGRVKSIKSKFENLNNLESLDISSPILNKYPKPASCFQFKRSSTSIDLPRYKLNNKIESDRKTIALRKHNDLERKISDSFLLKNRNVISSNKDTLKPLKEIKENVEISLNRHTSDPIKRGSIKRSPAFRVGDKSNKIGLTTKTTAPVITKEFSDKFDELLERCVTDSQKLQEAGLTDTLKAVLRQPLPTGPPPKKPPRTFIDSPSPPRDNIQPFQLFPNELCATSSDRNDTKISSPPRELQNKIDLLENQLVLKPATKKKTNRKGFFNCIPCSSTPIYDTMIVNSRQSIESIKSPKSINVNNNRKIMSLGHEQQPKKNISEHIYMEPFGHLKLNSLNFNNNLNSSNSSCVPENSTEIINLSKHNIEPPKLIWSGSSPDTESLDSSLLSCASCAAEDHSSSDLSGDIHYMCTTIDEKSKSSDSETNSNENEHHPLMLSNTYDEINILVNAAFGQHKVSESTGNTNDNGEMTSASAISMSASNQQKNTIKLYRTLTEKRKDYVRRVSSVKSTADNVTTYGSLHRTFKSPVLKTFSFDNDDHEYDIVNTDNNNSMDTSLTKPSTVSKRVQQFNQIESVTPLNLSSETAHEIESNDDKCENENEQLNSSIVAAPNDSSTKLFQVCLLIGYNNSTRQAYIKSKYPADEEVPQNIEQLVFPSRNLSIQNRSNQDYSLVLTDDSGYHVYGYCRRVLPESCETCLPLAYCLISEIKAPGFYFRILKEIESRHGQSEFQTNFLLQNLQNRSLPEAGKFLHLKLPLSPRPKTIFMSNHKIAPKRLSLEVNPKWLTESAAQAAFNNNDIGADGSSNNNAKKERYGQKSLVEVFEEKKQEKNANNAPFDLSLINRSLLSTHKTDEIFIRRPTDLRLESTELSDLYATLGTNLLITVFSSLLLERKVILFTENISMLSSCVLGLQTLLYPFQWQHTLITVLPQTLAEICQAPIPVLAGMLEPINFDIEDGIVVNLDNRTVTQKCGDETTILPNTLCDSLKVSLEMVDLLDQGKMLSSVLIAEAFLRFFVELFAGYKQPYFDKKLFINSHRSQTNRLFLEWFVETAMFRHFVHQKYSSDATENESTSADDVRLNVENNFYAIFDARVLEKSENKSNTTQQNMEMIMKNCRIINKKAKTFKDRFKDFLGNANNNNN